MRNIWWGSWSTSSRLITSSRFFVFRVMDGVTVNRRFAFKKNREALDSPKAPTFNNNRQRRSSIRTLKVWCSKKWKSLCDSLAWKKRKKKKCGLSQVILNGATRDISRIFDFHRDSIRRSCDYRRAHQENRAWKLKRRKQFGQLKILAVKTNNIYIYKKRKLTSIPCLKKQKKCSLQTEKHHKQQEQQTSSRAQSLGKRKKNLLQRSQVQENSLTTRFFQRSKQAIRVEKKKDII